MMLEALLALAERERLLSDTSYRDKVVHYRLRIADDGQPVELVPLGDDGRGIRMKAPSGTKKSSQIKSSFLVETTKYALGLPKKEKGSEPGEKAIREAPKCLADFAANVRVALAETDDPGLAALERFLRRVERDPHGERSRVTEMDHGHEWTGGEVIAFVCESDGATYIHDREEVRKYWAKRREAEASKGFVGRCLVTGQVGPTARLHDNVVGLPKPAKPQGAALVSFNNEAFASHGFDQGRNAPISHQAMDGYVRALNWLLAREGERRFRSGIRIGDDAVIVFWTRDENETADVLVSLFDPPSGDEERLRATFEAAWKGLPPRDVDATQFYALTLSGNASRVVVRDWLETTAAEVKANVRRYFDDLALDGDGSPLSIGRLLRSLQANPAASGDKRGLPPSLSARLLNAALRGSAFPRELLHAALARFRVPPRTGDWRRLLHARAALVKAVLRRPPFNQEVTVGLDETNASAPYQLGRLFAAIEKLQEEALDDVKATLRDRYFGSASTTPGLVFPRLLKLSMHHASKAEARRGTEEKWRGHAERVKAQIFERLPPEPFPRTLDLEAQGLFAIGYYHQRQAFFTPRKSDPGQPVT